MLDDKFTVFLGYIVTSKGCNRISRCCLDQYERNDQDDPQSDGDL